MRQEGKIFLSSHSVRCVGKKLTLSLTWLVCMRVMEVAGIMCLNSELNLAGVHERDGSSWDYVS